MGHRHSNITKNSNYNWCIVSTYLQKKLSGITNPKKVHMWQVGKILQLSGEKTVARTGIFLSFAV